MENKSLPSFCFELVMLVAVAMRYDTDSREPFLANQREARHNTTQHAALSVPLFSFFAIKKVCLLCRWRVVGCSRIGRFDGRGPRAK